MVEDDGACGIIWEEGWMVEEETDESSPEFELGIGTSESMARLLDECFLCRVRGSSPRPLGN